MIAFDTLWLVALFLVVALLYASVGQAGATGYLAVMGFFGIAPTTMKTTALALNLVVAAIGTALFARAGLLAWRTFYPFAVLGFPFSLLGGAVQLPTRLYYPVVGAILILAAAQLLRVAASGARTEPADPPVPARPRRRRPHRLRLRHHRHRRRRLPRPGDPRDDLGQYARDRRRHRRLQPAQLRRPRSPAPTP